MTPVTQAADRVFSNTFLHVSSNRPVTIGAVATDWSPRFDLAAGIRSVLRADYGLG
jgi:hypothetical protein